MVTSNISDDFGEYDNDDQLTVREVAICRSSWNQRMKNTYIWIMRMMKMIKMALC